MDVLVNFLLDNYIWFLIISLIIIFALIGYLVDMMNIKTRDRQQKKDKEN